jgi:hypothetical protein
MGSEAQLFAVTYFAQGTAFAVGQYVDPQKGFGLGAAQTFAVRWDPVINSWIVSPTLNVQNVDNRLYGVSGAAPDDVWAVGVAGAQGQTLAQHWDGAKWSIVATPNVGGQQAFNSLNAVTAPKTDFVFAAGAGNGNQTLVTLWDGQQWSVVPSDNAPDTRMLGGYDMLNGVATDALGGVWCVGQYTPSAQSDLEMLILTGDQNGAKYFHQPKVPAVKQKDRHYLRDICFDLAGNGWAVGTKEVDNNGLFLMAQTLVVSFAAGAAAATVVQDQPNGLVNGLNAVVAVSENDVWAVGWYNNFVFPQIMPPQCLMEHWDGNKWTSWP